MCVCVPILPNYRPNLSQHAPPWILKRKQIKSWVIIIITGSEEYQVQSVWCLSPLFCRVCHCPWAVESPAWGSSLHHWLSGEGGWAHVRDDLRFQWGCTSQTSQQAAKATICIALIYPDWRLRWCPSFGSTGDSEVRLEATVEANYIKKKLEVPRYFPASFVCAVWGWKLVFCR